MCGWGRKTSVMGSQTGVSWVRLETPHLRLAVHAVGTHIWATLGEGFLSEWEPDDVCLTLGHCPSVLLFYILMNNVTVSRILWWCWKWRWEPVPGTSVSCHDNKIFPCVSLALESSMTSLHDDQYDPQNWRFEDSAIPFPPPPRLYNTVTRNRVDKHRVLRV